MANRSDQPSAVQSPESTLPNPGDQAPAGTPHTGENICRDCLGSGIQEGRPCVACGGTGQVIENIGDA